MAKFTLFELHVDDAQFSANAPFSGRGSGSDETEEALEASGTEDDSDDSGGSVLGTLAGLAVFVVLAIVARKLLSGGADAEAGETPTAEPIEAD